MQLPGWLKNKLGSKHLVRASAAVAVLFGLPTLGTGLAIDDWLMKAKSQGYAPIPSVSPFDLFTFMKGDPAEVKVWVSRGLLPWFTSDQLKFRFLRPVTSLGHYVDYTLFGAHPMLMHAENVAWYAVAAALAAILYRRLVGTAWIAGLAAMFFVVDDSHGVALGWISNRNALLAGVFTLATLVLHDRWRRDGWRPGAVLGPLCLGLGLLSAELGLGAAGYLAAYALTLDRARPARRVLSLAPYAAVMVAWLGMYLASGCGARGSGMYIDPMREPGTYFAALPVRLATLLLAQLALPPSDTWMAVGGAPAAWLVVPAAVLFLAWLGRTAVPLLRHDPAARFFALGLVLSALPCGAMQPSDRLLMLVGIGGAGLVALTVAAILGDPAPAAGSIPTRQGARALAWSLLFANGVFAPIVLPLTSQVFNLLGRRVAEWRDHVDVGRDIDQKALVVVNTPMSFVAYAWAVPRAADDVVPKRGAILSVSTAPVAVARKDERTLTLRPADGFTAEFTTQLFRSRRYRSNVGDVARFDGWDVTVDAVDAQGLPLEASIRFDTPLEDASRVWVTWNGERFVRYTPPAIGSREVLPSKPWP